MKRQTMDANTIHCMVIFVLAIGTFALVILLAGCGGQPQKSNVGQVPRSGTVFVGDSLFGRWDLDAAFPGKGYVNAGWFGHKTGQSAQDFPAILDGSKVCHGYIPDPGNPPDPAFPFSCATIPPPARVVILLGWNDMFAGLNMQVAAANIDAMARQAKAEGVQVVLVVPYRFDSAHPATWMQPFLPCAPDGQYPFSGNQEPVLNAGIKATAAQLRIPVVDLESLFCLQADYTVDGVHPNASGYAQMQPAIAGVL